jgi:diacylglycerol kinase (ATP)
VTFLLLTNAGAGSADRERVDVVVRILEADGPVEIVSLDHAAGPEQALDRRGGRRLVVAGGDGTLHRTVAVLQRRGELAGTDLGLIPLGTGNDFARSAGVPLEPEDAAQAVLTGTVQPVDLVVDDAGDIAVNLVYLGVGAEASRRGARWKERLGRIGYAVGMLQASVSPAFRFEIELDGEPVAAPDRPVLEVSIGNGATVGGGLALNPGADPADGRLDVVVSYAAGPLRRLSYGLDLLRQRHPERSDVLRRTCDTVSVAGAPFYISADGEISGPVPRRTWHVERAAMRMVLLEQRHATSAERSTTR